MVDYEITIENCNSIDTAKIAMKKGSLNIKFGPNGLGKSTIAKAIVSQARDDAHCRSLCPSKAVEKQAQDSQKLMGLAI
jgi:ABC-type Mn2+/Zn2+ transport system ATPase subunit